MTETNETVDLWGDIITEPMRTPQLILKEQGALLEKKTNGILTVEVDSSTPDRRTFQHAFKIKSANMNYLYEVFFIRHPIEIYPVYLYSSVLNDSPNEAVDEETFMNVLKKILQSEKIHKIINSLISQSTGV